MVIELKGLEPGQSAAFSDRTGFIYESSYNGYILPILRGDTLSKSWEFYKKYVAFFNGIKIEMKDRATLWFGNECNKIDLDKPSLGYNLRIHFEKHAKESGLSPKK